MGDYNRKIPFKGIYQQCDGSRQGPGHTVDIGCAGVSRAIVSDVDAFKVFDYQIPRGDGSSDIT